MEAALIITARVSYSTKGSANVTKNLEGQVPSQLQCHQSMPEADRTLTSLAVKEEEARRQRIWDALDADRDG